MDIGPVDSSLGLAELADLTDDDLRSRLDDLFRLKAMADGRIIELLGEVERREAFRDEGATSTEAWAHERFSVSVPTARAYTHVAERAWDIPQLVEALCIGEITFDQLRAVADVATPENDSALRERVRSSSLGELAEFVRSERADRGPALERRAEKDYELRSLRFNDQFRTVTAQLPPEAYVQTKSCLEGRARELPTDGETPWDQRLCDAFLQTIGSAGGDAGDGRGDGTGTYFVVVHVPLAALVDQDGETTDMAGDLERGQLISCETVRRIACDATITIAVDDDDGHTMYQGRTRRDPTGAQRREVWRRDRHCRFPGCSNATFAHVHHTVPWVPDGLTDLPNLVLLCEHHHRRLHSKQWRMSGDANRALTFVGPTGREMTSRPSPMWTAATGGRTNRGGKPPASRPRPASSPPKK